jgi:hypothetical protein
MPSLEVRRCGDGHPPLTERERVIHLNGTGGVKFCERPGLIVDPGLFSFSGAKRSTSNVQFFKAAPISS